MKWQHKMLVDKGVAALLQGALVSKPDLHLTEPWTTSHKCRTLQQTIPTCRDFLKA